MRASDVFDHHHRSTVPSAIANPGIHPSIRYAGRKPAEQVGQQPQDQVTSPIPVQKTVEPGHIDTTA